VFNNHCGIAVLLHWNLHENIASDRSQLLILIMLRITTNIRLFFTLTKKQHSRDITPSKKEMLARVAESINIRVQPTAILEDE
jgi:hypothetical protein